MPELPRPRRVLIALLLVVPVCAVAGVLGRTHGHEAGRTLDEALRNVAWSPYLGDGAGGGMRATLVRWAGLWLPGWALMRFLGRVRGARLLACVPLPSALMLALSGDAQSHAAVGSPAFSAYTGYGALWVLAGALLAVLVDAGAAGRASAAERSAAAMAAVRRTPLFALAGVGLWGGAQLGGVGGMLFGEMLDGRLGYPLGRTTGILSMGHLTELVLLAGALSGAILAAGAVLRFLARVTAVEVFAGMALGALAGVGMSIVQRTEDVQFLSAPAVLGMLGGMAGFILDHARREQHITGPGRYHPPPA